MNAPAIFGTNKKLINYSTDKSILDANVSYIHREQQYEDIVNIPKIFQIFQIPSLIYNSTYNQKKYKVFHAIINNVNVEPINNVNASDENLDCISDDEKIPTNDTSINNTSINNTSINNTNDDENIPTNNNTNNDEKIPNNNNTSINITSINNTTNIDEDIIKQLNLNEQTETKKKIQINQVIETESVNDYLNNVFHYSRYNYTASEFWEACNSFRTPLSIDVPRLQQQYIRTLHRLPMRDKTGLIYYIETNLLTPLKQVFNESKLLDGLSEWDMHDVLYHIIFSVKDLY